LGLNSDYAARLENHWGTPKNVNCRNKNGAIAP
jgi:hypothetical protein